MSENHSADSENHWYACTVCGKQNDLQAHTPEPLTREGAMQRCTVCQYSLTPELLHIHAYDTVYMDGEIHWGTCSCGQDMPRESHQWSVRTNSCAVCGQSMPQNQADLSELLPWIAIGAVILLCGILLLILVLRKKK